MRTESNNHERAPPDQTHLHNHSKNSAACVLLISGQFKSFLSLSHNAKTSEGYDVTSCRTIPLVSRKVVSSSTCTAPSCKCASPTEPAQLPARVGPAESREARRHRARPGARGDDARRRGRHRPAHRHHLRIQRTSCFCLSL